MDQRDQSGVAFELCSKTKSLSSRRAGARIGPIRFDMAHWIF
jgi:hypothetical protein